MIVASIQPIGLSIYFFLINCIYLFHYLPLNILIYLSIYFSTNSIYLFIFLSTLSIYLTINYIYQYIFPPTLFIYYLSINSYQSIFPSISINTSLHQLSPFINLSFHRFYRFYQSINQSIYLYINLSIDLSIYLSIHPLINLSINLSFHLYLTTFLSIFPSKTYFSISSLSFRICRCKFSYSPNYQI